MVTPPHPHIIDPFSDVALFFVPDINNQPISLVDQLPMPASKIMHFICLKCPYMNMLI